ncbi:LLM class flavin-dependent oxidoreductase, partial [Clavibacter phaseoli]
FADFVEELGDDADNDGLLLSGDLHPVTLHRMLDDLVPVLRRRGILRDELAPGGLRANLFD